MRKYEEENGCETEASSVMADVRKLNVCIRKEGRGPDADFAAETHDEV